MKTLSKLRRDYSEALKLYESGLSLREVARHFNVAKSTIRECLIRRGFKRRPQKRFGNDNHFYRGGITASDRAHNTVEAAIRKGLIKRKIVCDRCGSTPVMRDGRTGIQAHHVDYNKPLQVEWLCQECHHLWHKNNRAKRERHFIPAKH